ncbi:hypothetical protein FEM48_Zijuj01G0012500 [Ziziphus jujuba var. spinosa]|uniref:Spermidine hydroxycinnamoyl transferase-like n=1 Tax=Ziziphus jujuba var. spinosa TaxID=714518 RepID=A0A978VYA6_ZIZJJ|nr:spermidine hydroxycinnamoyl transferase-like [Ziziphus jujuba var. spinosa]KAH7544690.1 hypothetical protein FEM48_Zijuj01G0012500 [Ziziphus jujuba var. spinosa]
MEVRVKKCYTVKPEEKTWEGCQPLSELDQTGCIGHVPSLYFYRPSQNWLTPANNVNTITNILKQSLSRVLVPFYPLAGRLQSIGRGRVQINCNSMGVPFIEAESDSELDEYFGDLYAAPPSLRYDKLVPNVDYSTTPIHERPLLLVQLTSFSSCGLVCLGISMSHTVIDGYSAFHFLSEWTRFARNKPLETVPFLDRKAAFRAGDPPLAPTIDNPPLPSLSIHADKDKKKKGKSVASAILKLSKDQVERLKHMANEGRGETTRAYTRFESLAGYIWRCTCKARKHRMDHHPTGLAIYVDARSRMKPPLPKGYFGNAAVDVIATGDAVELVSKPLGFAASRVREAIERVTDAYVRSTINYLKNQPDLTRFKDIDEPQSIDDLGFTSTGIKPDQFVVSWLTFPIYGVDFGWGDEIYFDPGTYEHFDGATFIMPSPSGDGSVIVALDLEAPYMETFKEDFYRDIHNSMKLN